MKAICPVCEQVFTLSHVIFGENSGVIQKKRVNDGIGVAGFSLLPSHPPTSGKAVTNVINSATGEIVEVLCNGSLRPPKISIH